MQFLILFLQGFYNVMILVQRLLLELLFLHKNNFFRCAIANSLHPVSDVTVTTRLPDGVSLADKYLVRSGSIAYGQKDNTVTWNLDRIGPNKTFDDTSAWFDVAVVPTKDQVRKLLILTDQTILSATDDETDSEVTKLGKAITSNLEDDPIATGKGLVVDITE